MIGLFMLNNELFINSVFLCDIKKELNPVILLPTETQLKQ